MVGYRSDAWWCLDRSRHLEIIDDQYQAIKVTFSQTIKEITRLVYPWLWELADGQSERKNGLIIMRVPDLHRLTNTIITSEYNMDCVKEWSSEKYPNENNRQFELKQYTAMKTNSINKTAAPSANRDKNCYNIRPAYRPKQAFYQYDYRHTDGNYSWSSSTDFGGMPFPSEWNG